MSALAENRVATSQVDNTDLLKAAAIFLVAIDHFAIYFVETEPLDDWLQVVGRLAAPVFFFLVGFATSRTVPIRWLVLGCILTLFDAWGDDWDWGPGSILFSFALFRFVRPYLRKILCASRIGTFALIACLVIASTVDEVSQYIEPLALYGASGWLWALLGLCQREYVDAQDSNKGYFALLRSLLLPVTLCVFWLRTAEHYSDFTMLGTLAVTSTILALVLVRFKRGASGWQPSSMAASLVLRFLGHNTLEIYAAQLILSPIISEIWPQLVL